MIREANLPDIPGIQVVRNNVKENRLSDPSLVPDKDVADYITRRGRGWVYEIDKTIIGFAIVSVLDSNVWALFIEPVHEKKGIGQQLHKLMLDWYFSQSPDSTLWLSTAPRTRAEKFYRKAGWIETGVYGQGEIKFEMEHGFWTVIRPSDN